MNKHEFVSDGFDARCRRCGLLFDFEEEAMSSTECPVED